MNKSIILITEKAWDKIFKINKLSINHFGSNMYCFLPKKYIRLKEIKKIK